MNWQRALILIVFALVVFYNGYGQVAEYSERDYGTLITRRNDPSPKNKQDRTIIQCRKLNKVEEVFGLSPFVHDISQAILKPFNNLTDIEKGEIVPMSGIEGILHCYQQY